MSNVAFSTSAGDCFGMLGMNGAGKSTVFKILSGVESPVVGDVYLVPYSLLGDRSDVCCMENLIATHSFQLYG